MGIKKYRTYEEPWEFIVFHIKDEYYTWQANEESPVKLRKAKNFGQMFPYLINADFSSYEGFRKFTNLFGLQGFAEFNESLESILNDAERTGKSIARDVLESTFKKLEPVLKKEQRDLSVFFETLFQNSVYIQCFSFGRYFSSDFLTDASLSAIVWFGSVRNPSFPIYESRRLSNSSISPASLA